MRHLFQVLTMLALLAGLAPAVSLGAEQPADSSPAPALLPSVALTGHVVSAEGNVLPNATIAVGPGQTTADPQGAFRLSLPPGDYQLRVAANGYAPVTLPLSLKFDTDLQLQLGSASSTDVVARADQLTSDPSSQSYDASQLLAAHPGQPGVPVSIPGFPAETASGGVKAPQYFAPGVAGDHGEPIAQYFRIGDFLVPNNLPANAHGNGYADPNLLIAPAIGGVDTDAGAFDVRHGNNAENLAVAYGIRPRLEPFVQVTGDMHDYDFVTGWSPANPQTAAWVGLEVAGGDGFLALPENRKQYKVNGQRAFTLGRHLLTLFGGGYYGSSRIPGLTPIDIRVPGDTIDPRQADRTYTSLLVATDTWQVSDRRQVQFSGFFRAYSLDLRSDFGDGLIRQSEERTVVGGNTSFTQKINSRMLLAVGLDARQDAPRNAELAHADSSGVFHAVTLNNFSINDFAPYIALSGTLSSYFNYSVGVRREQILFSNTDRLIPGNSYQTSTGLTLPRATIGFRLPGKPALPSLAFSYGEAFHTNDPRIGLGTTLGTPVATARACQVVASEEVARTLFRVVLSQVSNSQQLAKIDPDTGLQQDLGPSLVRSAMVSAQRQFSFGFLQATFARARATDRLTGGDVPEAPRLIWSVSGTSTRLPWQMRASGGFEYVGIKPLGDGFTARPVRELRGSLSRSLHDGLLDVGVNFLAVSGYTGQTLEDLQLSGESAPSTRIVGVPTSSWAGVTLTYHLRDGR